MTDRWGEVRLTRIRAIVAEIVAREQDVILDPRGTIIPWERLQEVLKLWDTQDQRVVP